MIQDRRDFLGGLLLLGAGSAIALYAATHYSLGTAQRMGPGMSSLGDRRFNIINAVIVSVGMSLMSYLIFVVGLNLPFIMFRWSL